MQDPSNEMWQRMWYFGVSLGPVYEFVCVSFRTGNLNWVK